MKDLRQYLSARDINTVACREKHELVDLVVQYLATRNGSKFMVTVNNLEEESPSVPVPPTASEPPRTQGGASRINPQGPGVGDTQPQPSQEPTRQTWVSHGGDVIRKRLMSRTDRCREVLCV